MQAMIIPVPTSGVLRGLWAAATVYNPGELVGYDNDLYQGIYSNSHTAASTNMPGTGGTTTLSNAAVESVAGGKVDIPCTSHGIAVGAPIVIAGTVNYNGEYVVLTGTGTHKIRITHAYTAETLAGTETVTYNGAIYWAKRVEGLTTDQVAALVGISGTALSASNKVSDEADPARTDARQLPSFATVTAMEAATGINNNYYACVETGAVYVYSSVAGDFFGTVDHLYVCSTGAGGNTRFIAVFGTYSILTLNISDGTNKAAITAALLKALENSGATPTDPVVKSSNAGLLRIYADITAAKAATGVGGLIGIVLSPLNTYRGLAAGSAYTANDKSVLVTGDAGNTRWIGMGPLYVADGNLPNVITAAASGSLTAAQASGTFITNNGQGQANEQELPASVPGMSFIATIQTAGAGAFTLDPNGSEIVILNGTALAAGNKVTCATPAVGNIISFWCLTAGTWIANSTAGAWTDGGA